MAAVAGSGEPKSCTSAGRRPPGDPGAERSGATQPGPRFAADRGGMDDHRNRPASVGTTTRGVVQLLLGATLIVVAALTLTPDGTGWTWGSPINELRWYVTGLDSTATTRQLLGNLGLLAVPAALVVVLLPSVGRTDRLVALAIAAGTGIELLQYALPLGRVVSPLDALLNATGAVAAGLLVRHLQRLSASAAATRADRFRSAAHSQPRPRAAATSSA